MKQKRKRTTVIKFPNLLAEMKKRGETQYDLAKMLKVTQATMSRKLAGKVQWRIGEIEDICEHYDKGYYELFK